MTAPLAGVLARWLSRRAAARGRRRTAWRLLAFGSEELAKGPHYPLPDPDWPGYCACGLAIDDPLHVTGRGGT